MRKFNSICLRLIFWFLARIINYLLRGIQIAEGEEQVYFATVYDMNGKALGPVKQPVTMKVSIQNYSHFEITNSDKIIYTHQNNTPVTIGGIWLYFFLEGDFLAYNYRLHAKNYTLHQNDTMELKQGDMSFWWDGDALMP